MGEDNSNTLEDKPSIDDDAVVAVPEGTAQVEGDLMGHDEAEGGNGTSLLSYWTDAGEQEQERVSLRNSSDARGIFSQIVQTMSLGSKWKIIFKKIKSEKRGKPSVVGEGGARKGKSDANLHTHPSCAF